MTSVCVSVFVSVGLSLSKWCASCVQQLCVLCAKAARRCFRRRMTKRLYIPLPDAAARNAFVRHLMKGQSVDLSDADYDIITRLSKCGNGEGEKRKRGKRGKRRGVSGGEREENRRGARGKREERGDTEILNRR
jgi:hypothetical protein